MTDLDGTFNRLRPRLQAIAYRMLGSMAEAEDVVQDAWLRWHEGSNDAVENTEAWLVTITTRLAIDRLRAAKVRREAYAGIWLPEPVLSESPPSPEQAKEFVDDVSVAFLVLLERLAPEARAAFLLREVFDADYDEVARALGKSEAACRQMVSRAKAQLREGRPRQAVPHDEHHRLLARFAEAVNHGDFPTMVAMLAEDAQLVGDGGGRVPSFPKPLEGGRRIAQLLYAPWRRIGEGMRVEVAVVNGRWGLLRFMDGVLESVQAFELDDERIVRMHVQRNPEKLARIAATLSVATAA